MSEIARPVISQASQLGYTPSGTGAVHTTVAAKLRETICVLDFQGADPTGTTDSLAAFNAAKTEACIQKKPIRIPAGIYLLSGTWDCRSIGNDNFAGIVGDGPERSILIITGSDVPGIRVTGRYFKLSGFSVKYQTQQTTAETNSNCVQFEDWVYFATLEQLLLSNGRRGIGHVEGDDSARVAAAFSNTLSDIRCLDNSHEGALIGGAGGGTGNDIRNFYISAPNLAATSRGITIQGGTAQLFNQLNIEQANIRDCAIYFSGCDNITLNGLHIEGVRLFGNGTSNGESINSCFIRSNNRGTLIINGWVMDGNFIGPHKVLSLTRSGSTLTIVLDPLDAQSGSAGDGIRVGDTVTIGGASDANYNTAFTVASVSGNTLTAAIGTTPTSPATVASGSDYMTCALGSAIVAMDLLKMEATNGVARIRGFRIRDTIILSSTSATRNGLLRMANAQSTSNPSVFFEDVQTIQQNGDSPFIENMPIVGRSRTSNVATVYTLYPHKLLPFQSVNVAGMASSGYNDIKGITPTGEFSFTYSNTGSDLALARETTGTALVAQYQSATRARASNIATVTTSAAHGFKVGSRIALRNFAVSSYADTETVVLSVPNATTFTYANSGTDEGSTADTNARIMLLDAGLGNTIPNPSTSRCVKLAGPRSRGCVVADFGSITTGSSATFDLSFINTHVGDVIKVYPQSSLGLVITASVTATGTIRFTAVNPSGSTVDATAVLIVFEVAK